MPISVGTRIGACAAPPDAIGDVYVRPFPEGEPAQRISTDGGFEPSWSPDGRRFVLVLRHDIEPQPAMTIELVLRFMELKERVPTQP
jgi:hypothetical protein